METLEAVAIYSIKDLEKLSGIKAHTIRAWEQRYSLMEPKRTKSNIRYYEDEDLRYLLNIALLKKDGFKISKIAEMSREEIERKVTSASDVNSGFGTYLDALTLSMIEMDESKFDRIIATNIQQHGFERTMLDVIYPFLDKLSVLWLTGSINPVQENFMSYLIRQKLIVAIDQVPLETRRQAKKFLLYLPEGEKQELSLLFMHYILKVRGNQVVYLGQEVNLGDLEDACSVHNPDYIFTMITETFAQEPVQDYIDRLSEGFPKCNILLSGYQVVAQRVESRENVTILKSLDQALQFLEQVSGVRGNGA